MQTRLRLGIDIGGTKTEVVVLDTTGAERCRYREPTPHGSYEEALECLVVMEHEAERAVGDACTVGIGTPGSLSPSSGRLRNAHATPYNGRSLLCDLEVRLGRAARSLYSAQFWAPASAAVSWSADVCSKAPTRSRGSGGTIRFPRRRKHRCRDASVDGVDA